MTAADHTQAEQAVAQRARTDDPPNAAGRGSGPGLLNQMIENPLLSLFGAVIAVLLGFVLTTSNIRISETNVRITETNDRITSLGSRIDTRIDRLEDRIWALESRIGALESRIGALEGSVAGIDRKLTALIAALDKTEEVEGALSGDVGVVQTPEPPDEAAGP